MTFKVKIQEVNVDTVQKGKSRYQIAVVNYIYGDQARQQKLFSFANPQAFTAIQKVKPGDFVEVTTVKNDAGYNDWAKVELVNPDNPETGKDTAPAAKSTKVLGSNYETPEERAKRQLMIVRQSSISNAIEYLHNVHREGEPSYNVNDVLNVAQEFVDFVYGTNDLLEGPDDRDKLND